MELLELMVKTKTLDSAINRVLAKLPDARQVAEAQWSARCPIHDDHNASLSIGVGDRGNVLLHCHAGCDIKDIVNSLGLRMLDLAPPDHGQPNGNGKPRIEVTYDYRDESGKLLYQAVRYQPKGFKQRAPKPGGGWSWSVKGVRKVPYRLSELLASDPAEWVFVVEGEKDVDQLIGSGLVATCNAGGAGKWLPEYAQHFQGRRVVSLPDNDGPGHKHTEDVARSVYGKAESVRVVDLPDLPDHGDVSDWLDNGGTVAKLCELVEATPEWKPGAGPVATALAKALEFALTDTGNAERFAKQHGPDVRYCFPWSKWFAWDGRRWNLDSTGTLERLAKQTVRSVYGEAAAESDDARRKAIANWGKSSESACRRSAMLQLARSELPIPVLPDDLDRDPWLLNCGNGTLDLRTGKLRPHDQGDLITKVAPVEYLPESPCPTWQAFLDRILDSRQELIGFVQRLTGYFLTGSTRDHVLPIFYGTGANGKSTMVNALQGMMGPDYAMKAPPALLMLKRGDAHPTERADLHGKRFVACLETEQGRRLAESMAKELSGGDRVRARRMREDYWEFAPSHKIVLATNHKPVVKGTDVAIWRRLLLVPFDVTIPPEQQDHELGERLAVELPGILAWSVRGCLEWQRQGLAPPAEVQAATAHYQVEQDTLGEFINSCCAVGPVFQVAAGELFDAYVEWTGDKHTTKTRFGLTLQERGFNSIRSRTGGRCWAGIGLAEGGES